MAENTIEVAITAESVTNLKRAITVLKDAYKKSASTQILSNEASLLPILLPQINALKSDVLASKTSLESYSKISLDQIGKPQSTTLNSLQDLDNLSGNYPITPELVKDAKNTVNRIMGDTEGRKSIATTDTVGGQFIDQTASAYGNPITTANTGGQQIAAETVNSGAISLGDSGGNFSNTYANKKSGSILKECIPCDLRLSNLGEIDPLGDLLGMLEQDLLNRYTQLLNRIKSLLSNNEIYNDLCSLLNFLNFQCLPDLFGIVALLSALAMKLTDVKLINPAGAFMSFISPFFAPMLNGLNDILDKYIQLILGPIDCVLTAVDTQLGKIDVGSALDQAANARRSQLMARISFQERKAASLIERRNFLLETDDNGDFVNEPNAYQVVDRRADNNNNGLNAITTTKPPFFFVTREEEINNIDQELREIQGVNGNDGNLGKMRAELATLKKTAPTANAITGARGDIKEFRNTLGSSLQSIRDYILDGRAMINDTANVWKKELQRTLFGRAATTEDMLQAAEDLQRIARIIGIVNVMINFANLAKSGKLCNNNTKDPSAALGSFLTAASASNNSQNAPVVATATDENGNAVMLITSSDAVLELEGENQTTKLDNLAQLNQSGIAANLGSLANVKVTATTALGNAAPVAIVKFNLCGEVSSSTKQNLDIIKKWASNLGN